MSGSAPHRSYPAILELRKVGGRWLQKLRERRGLSQSDLARLVGAEYHTYISQLEIGRGRISPKCYRLWAEALDVKPQDFVRQLMSFYDPVTYEILFGTDKASWGQPRRPFRNSPALGLTGSQQQHPRDTVAADCQRQ